MPGKLIPLKRVLDDATGPLFGAEKEQTVAENPKEQPSKGEGKSKRGRKKRGWCLADRPVLEANAAGIDLGAREL